MHSYKVTKNASYITHFITSHTSFIQICMGGLDQIGPMQEETYMLVPPL